VAYFKLFRRFHRGTEEIHENLGHVAWYVDRLSNSDLPNTKHVIVTRPITSVCLQIPSYVPINKFSLKNTNIATHENF
jgi:hypothetical protein